MSESSVFVSHRPALKSAAPPSSTAKRAALSESLRKDQRRQQIGKRRQNLQTTNDRGNPAATTVPTTADVVSAITDLTHCTSVADELRPLTALRIMTSHPRCPLDDASVVNALIPTLISFLSSRRASFDHLLASLSILSNIAADYSPLVTAAVMEAAPYLIALIKSDSKELAEHAAFVLGNLAVDDVAYRHTLIRRGILPPAIALFASAYKQTDQTLIQTQVICTAAWMIGHLLRDQMNADTIQIVSATPLFDVAIYYFSSASTSDLLTESAWLLSSLHSSSAQLIEHDLAQALYTRVSWILQQTDHTLITPSLSTAVMRIIGLICAGDDRLVDALFTTERISTFLQFIYGSLISPPSSTDQRALQKESLWTLHNLCSSNHYYYIPYILVIDQNNNNNFLLLLLMKFLQHYNSYLKLQIECAFVLFCLLQYQILKQKETNNNNNNFKLFDIQDESEERSIIRIYISFIDNNVSDADAIEVALRFLETILPISKRLVNAAEECDVIAALESLHRHEHPTVYDRAQRIIDTYWGDDVQDDDDTDISVQAADDDAAMIPAFRFDAQRRAQEVLNSAHTYTNQQFSSMR